MSTAIDRREVQALHNRAKQLVLTMGWLGKAQELRFAQGALSAYAGLLSATGHEFVAARDDSMGGYHPLAGFEAAWAALPEGAKNYSLAQVQDFLRLHAVELSGDAIANMQVNSVEGFKDSIVSPVDLHNEHDAARAQVGDGSGGHCSNSCKTAVLAMGQGSGKSHVAQTVADLLGCTSIVDEWDPSKPLSPGALHLTNDVILVGGAA